MNPGKSLHQALAAWQLSLLTAYVRCSMFIADTYNNVVRKVSPSGIITTFAGNGTAGWSGDNGPATAATLETPCGLALGANGR